MRKCYLLVYGPSVASYQQMKAVMNTIPEVKTWRTDIPNCFYVVSETDATTLAKLVRAKTGSKGRFIISEMSGNGYGWLTKESWYFLKNKRVMPKEEG